MTEIKNKITANDLTPDEKISLLSGENIWHTHGIERLNVRALTLRDGPHGVRDGRAAISYPNLCLLACSWDKELLKTIGGYIGDDAAEHDVDVLLAPGVNIKRTPTGGRNFEYFSEDPLLTGELAAAFVNGVQSRGVAACVKHFVCNDRENGRFSYNVNVDEKTLREVYVKPFEIVIDKAAPECVMSAYNRVNGSFAGSSARLNEILRKDLGFDGVVASDWGGTDRRVDFYNNIGDLEMPGSDDKTHNDVKTACETGNLSIERINSSVDRILKLIGLCSAKKSLSDKKDIAKAAAESMVLLENNGILPLGKSTKIAVVGTSAKENVFCGGGCACVDGDCERTVFDELKTTFKNADYFETPCDLLKGYDAVIVFVRERNSSEGFDRSGIEIDCELLKNVWAYNKNVVTVLINGSVIQLSEVKKYSAAIIESYYAGQAEGSALSFVLSGDCVPSGRLAETFVKDVRDCYAYGEETGEQLFYREGTSVGYRYYLKNGIHIEYPFGFGLSYTKFEYSDFSVDKNVLTENDDGVTISVKIKNIGDFDGKEVVQIYLNSDGKNGNAIIKLVAFDKFLIKKGEKKEVSLFVPFKEFTVYDTIKRKYVLPRENVGLSVNYNAENEIASQNIMLAPSFNADRYTTIGELIKTEKGAEITKIYLKRAIVGCIVGDDDNYPFNIEGGHICGEKFFTRVAESLQLRQLVSMSNNKLSESDLKNVLNLINDVKE